MKKQSRVPDFTKRFKEFYLSTGDTTSDFAENAGITRQAMNTYLNDNHIPSSEALKKICLAYRVSADYLLGLSDVQTIQ